MRKLPSLATFQFWKLGTDEEGFLSYRPITDFWILARAKLKTNPDGSKNTWYGSYLGGFPERARALLGVTLQDPVLHVCGGKARFYPYKRGFGPNDKTLDLDASLKPDFLHDAREPLPGTGKAMFPLSDFKAHDQGWPAILADPPYSEADAAKYTVGADAYPKPNLLLKNCIDAVRLGGRVGIISYIWAAPPKNAMSIATVGVLCGFNNRIRLYAVYERLF